MTLSTIIGTNLLCDWRADLASSIYEDNPPTDTAEDGDPVAAWTSTGDLSQTAYQNTLAERPIYRADYNSSGYPGLEFDGSNDGLLIPHHADWNVTGGITIFVVATLTSLANYRVAFSRHANSSWTSGFQLCTELGGVCWAPVVWNPDKILLPSPVGTRVLYICRADYDLTGADIILPGGTTSSAPSHTSEGGIGNGGQSGGNYPWLGAIHQVAAAKVPLELNTIAQAAEHLKTQWGLTSTLGTGSTTKYDPFKKSDYDPFRT